ncbi:MAG: acyl-CoA synthetase, partial [Candidatus Microthrix parvicella]
WCTAPPAAAFTYWDDPERTKLAWRTTSDGHAEFTVGDLGRLVDGYLYLDGRRDDLIISGGVNVYPAEVERVLRQADGVEDVAVFGVADDEWGEAVNAVVVPRSAADHTADTTLIDAVNAHAHASLAPYKRPKRVLVRASIPVSSTGKVRRSTLSSELAR